MSLPKPTCISDVRAWLVDVLDANKLDRLLDFKKQKDKPLVLVKPKRWLGRETFMAVLNKVKEMDGRYAQRDRLFEVPIVSKGEAPAEKTAPPVATSEEIVEGVIERVETLPDKDWIHVYVENVTKPLAIRPDLATPGLKLGNKIRAEVSIGSTWLFINRFDIPKEAVKEQPEPPQAEEPVAGPEPAKEPEKSAEPEASTKVEIEDETAYLRPTYEKLGALSPVLRAQSGEVIDGLHRLKVDPGWHSLVVYDINDPVKVAMARLVINVCRRQVPVEEKTELLATIAKLTEWTPQQIAEATGMSYTWVMKYLPDEYKQRPGAGPSEYPVTRRVTEPEGEARRAEAPPSQPAGLEPGPPKDVLLDRASKWYQTDLLDFVWQRVTIPERRQNFLRVFSAVEHELIVERDLLEEAWERAKTRFEKPEEITV